MNEIVDRWVRVWHEPDPDARRKAVAELWTEDATELVSSTTFHGHDALTERVGGAYQEFVAPGEYVFVSAGDVAGHHDMIVFTCHMLPAGGDEILWQARVVLQLAPDGRIRREDQIELQVLRSK
jgi:hypothetical protein